MPPRRPSTAEEILRMAAKMTVADPNVDNGAFSSLTTNDAMNWIMGLGHIHEVDPRMKTASNPAEQRKIAVENLRLGLWDVQRFEYLFPKNPYSKEPNFKLARLENWPNWKKPHPEISANGMGPVKLDGFKDAQRLQSYVMTHFHTMAFTQPEIAQGLSMDPPKGPLGNWIGVKKIMSHAAMDLTADGGRETPFVVYFQKDLPTMLIMEILDIKRVPWPEPDPKLLQLLQEAQEIKFGEPPGAPLVPMMQTPKIPLVAVRYSYLEGRPKGGSEFLGHLETRLKEILPPGTSDEDVRVELEKHLTMGEEMPAEHLRMFARLLSYNAELVDKEYVNDQQSHWNISIEAKKETRISFFVPCLRPRFNMVEEIETGKEVSPNNACGGCKKEAKTICGSCRGISYCSTDCAKAQWPVHKLHCKISKKITADPSSLPKDTLYVPARAYIHWVVDEGFACEQEIAKMGGPPVSEPPRNQYGQERFLCRALLNDAGKGQWDPHQMKIVYHDQGGGTVYLHDRRRSVIVRFGPQEPGKALVHGVVIPFHQAGYHQFVKVIRAKGAHSGQLLYVWVRRVGDCIEIDLKDIPNQQAIRWE
ncbi:hypothetical protein DFH06DRAFT_1160067 [Mycena polygramma]|nr:hypothetical protein DFH06DRAFT_1160067 [Mycena polygramma]